MTAQEELIMMAPVMGNAPQLSQPFAIGDWITLGSNSEFEYEVAVISRYPHGFMVGIYDEPPSKHVDFWNASSLTLKRKAIKQ